jgi:hypothetical protein
VCPFREGCLLAGPPPASPARGILLRSRRGAVVTTATRALPAACRSHLDGINKALAAGDDERAFYLAFQYFRARVRHIQGRGRESDARRFRRRAAHVLAELAAEVHDHRPGNDYRFSSLIPGGDWSPS